MLHTTWPLVEIPVRRLGLTRKCNSVCFLSRESCDSLSIRRTIEESCDSPVVGSCDPHPVPQFTVVFTSRVLRSWWWNLAIPQFLRKEVIQPQVPLRLPCYDLVPITKLALGAALPKVERSDFEHSPLSWLDGRCVQGSGTYSPRRG